MQLVQNHLWHDTLEGFFRQEVKQVALIRQGDVVELVDAFHQVLGKGAQLDEGTGGIRVGVLFGKPSQGCQFRPPIPQNLKIL